MQQMRYNSDLSLRMYKQNILIFSDLDTLLQLLT